MDKKVLRARISTAIRKASLFRAVENILEEEVLERMVDNIANYLLSTRYDRDRSLSYISEHLENGLEQSGVDFEDDATDSIALAILFIYEELLEDKSDFFNKIQEKEPPAIPSDSEE